MGIPGMITQKPFLLAASLWSQVQNVSKARKRKRLASKAENRYAKAVNSASHCTNPNLISDSALGLQTRSAFEIISWCSVAYSEVRSRKQLGIKC